MFETVGNISLTADVLPKYEVCQLKLKTGVNICKVSTYFYLLQHTFLPYPYNAAYVPFTHTKCDPFSRLLLIGTNRK